MRKKKGFTLVELLVVIAIIAILASVSVVGYLSFTNKAKDSNDQSMVTQANTILMGNEALGGKPETMYDAMTQVKSSGLDFELLKPTLGDNYFGWNEDTNRFVILNSDKITFPKNEVVTSNLNLWLIVDKYDANLKYSQYLRDTDYTTDTELNVDTGIDVGNNVEDFVINFTRSSEKNNILIRTNTSNTTLNINSVNDTIKHYGKAKVVNLEKTDLNDCYHEYGTVVMIIAKDSKVIVNKVANVYGLHLLNNNTIIEVKTLLTTKITKDATVTTTNITGYQADVTNSALNDALSNAIKDYNESHPEDNPLVSTSKWSGQVYDTYSASKYVLEKRQGNTSNPVNEEFGWYIEEGGNFKYIVRPGKENFSNQAPAKDGAQFNKAIENAKKYVAMVDDYIKNGVDLVLDYDKNIINVNSADALAILPLIPGYFYAKNQIKVETTNTIINPEYYFPGTNQQKPSWKIEVNCNIDLDNKQWKPINTITQIDFKGHFISNLKVTNVKKAGLFFDISNNISNLVITNAIIEADGSTDSEAGVVSASCKYVVDGVIVRNATVSNAKYTGGIIGYGYVSIINSKLDNVTVDGLYKTGGIVGYACNDEGGTEINNNQLTKVDIKSTKTLSGKTEKDKCIGKVVGQFNANGKVLNNILNEVTCVTDKIVGDTNGHNVEIK